MRQHVIHERMKYWAMALLLAATSGCAQHTAPTDHLETGQPFPALNVSDLDGQAAVLAAERGKLVVLNVWAAWCAACRGGGPGRGRGGRGRGGRRGGGGGRAGGGGARGGRGGRSDEGGT